MLRAESVPPNVVCTNTGEFLPRAQSEQPNFQQLATASPFRQYTTPSTVQATANLPIYRGVAATTGAGNIIAGPNIRVLRHNPLLNTAGRGYFDSDAVPSQYSNNFLNGSAAVADASNILLNNSTMQPNNHNNNHNNINNNLNNNNNNASPQCQSSPQRFIYHNNNTGATNNANITNQLQQHQPANTLNNQITPLNPPLNNYADNFRRWIDFQFGPADLQPQSMWTSAGAFVSFHSQFTLFYLQLFELSLTGSFLSFSLFHFLSLSLYLYISISIHICTSTSSYRSLARIHHRNTICATKTKFTNHFMNNH